MTYRLRSKARVLTCVLACATSVFARAADGSTISANQLQAEAQHEQQLAQACAASANACNPTLVDDNTHVAANGAMPEFTVSWNWMRDALSTARKASESDRHIAMLAAEDHLNELQQQANAAHDNSSFQHVSAQSKLILARSEFEPEKPASAWDRFKARFWALVARMFGGIQSVGEHNTWLWPLFEVLLYTAAAVAVLLLIRRSLARQRQAIALGAGAIKASAWNKEAEDWTAQASHFAEQQQWRDAVHCLYWSAIVGLEARRAWRHNPTRTPREYVRLLKPGSPQHAGLRGLTQLLEHVWYGLRDATMDDYQRAQSFHESLTTKTQAEAA